LYEESDSLSNEKLSSSLRYVQSYAYENICTPPQKEYTNWNQSHTRLPTSIVFRDLKNSSAKRSRIAATYLLEEPTIYGTLFEQDDPWDAIGQILGLSDTKPSETLGEVINELSEIDESEASQETNSAVVEMDEELMSLGSDEILQAQYQTLLEFNKSEELGSAKSECPELAYPPVEGYEEDQGYLLRDIEDKPLSQDLLEAPDRIKTVTEVVEFDSLESSERGSRQEAICNGEYNSVLAMPELQELDGLFMGPSLFDELDEEDEEGSS
jgi:hypothetical protein